MTLGGGVKMKRMGFSSPLNFLGTDLLHEDFRSRSWAQKVEEVLLSPRSDTRVCCIRQDGSDLPSSGIFQAGCRRKRGGKVRTAHLTQLHFQVPKRRAAGINTTTPLFSSHGPDKSP